MKAGKNVWYNDNDEYCRSETRPAEGVWYPYYAVSRVNGSSYTPYMGDTEWVRAANMAMYEIAAYNYKRKMGF